MVARNVSLYVFRPNKYVQVNGLFEDSTYADV